MRSPFQNKQLGTSMIELMIASALLAVVGMGATAFFKRITASDVEARAKAGAISEITLFLSTVERDFKLRPLPVVGEAPLAAVCAEPLCRDFKATRMVRYNSSAGALAGKDTQMDVEFSTVCATPPAHMADKFATSLSMGSLPTSPAGGTSNALNGRCFAKAGCAPGKYPQVVIKVKPVGPVVVPSYPRFDRVKNEARFPDLTQVKGVATGVIGAVLCGESGGSKSDRLILEASYVNSEGLMRIEKREVSIPRSNVANIQMLPNNDPTASSTTP